MKKASMLFTLISFAAFGQDFFIQNEHGIFVVAESAKTPLWRLDLPKINHERTKLLLALYDSNRELPPGIHKEDKYDGYLTIEGKFQKNLIPLESKLSIFSQILEQMTEKQYQQERKEVGGFLLKRGFPEHELDALFEILKAEPLSATERDYLAEVIKTHLYLLENPEQATAERVKAYCEAKHQAMSKAEEVWATILFESLSPPARVVLASFLDDRYDGIQMTVFQKATPIKVQSLQAMFKREDK